MSTNAQIAANLQNAKLSMVPRTEKGIGREVYPEARQFLITADSGGSNGSRVRPWKLELQKLELQKLDDETELQISVSHFPPGASKWNRIEHRLFSFITKNWRGRPLVSYEVSWCRFASWATESGMALIWLIGEIDNRQIFQVGDGNRETGSD